MLTGSRSIGRSSENTSMRSTSFTMRSASSQISRVRARSVLVADRLLQQLRGAADARERVLDLVRQHGGERRHRARGAAVRQLAVDLVGDGALLQHHDDVIGPLRHAARRGCRPCARRRLRGVPRSTRYSLTAAPRRAPDRSAPAAGCRRARTRERMPAQAAAPSLEESLRGGIGLDDLPSGPTITTGCGSASSTASARPRTVGSRRRVMPRRSRVGGRSSRRLVEALGMRRAPRGIGRR